MIRIGLVGCGHIGTVHAVALQQLADAELVDARLTATFDDDPERAAKVARHHGGEPHATLDALLDEVDVVWVCTWTAAHLAAVEAAADRGLADLLREAARARSRDRDARRRRARAGPAPGRSRAAVGAGVPQRSPARSRRASTAACSRR